MASHSRIRSGMTLEEFLRWPRIDRKPYLEYFDGRIEVKVSPQLRHNIFETNLSEALNRFARPAGLGLAVVEQRCTFGGRSILPDVTFFLPEHVPTDDRGEAVDETSIPPDIHVEVRSHEQSLKKTREKIEHSLRHGCPLGWFLDPYRKTIDVFRPGQPPERLPADGFLVGAPVLPGFRLPVAEVMGWLIVRKPAPDDPGGEPG